ncbi:MAG: NAD-dependent epimerase/dehydratase family protein [Clostridia bacterium]|nr:NAD-dependent epimerase/dehydratase family protein [Clostridia bacterium]
MILIVGCGYLGSYLAKEVLKNTDEPLVVTSRSVEKLTFLSSVRCIYCDVTDAESVIKLADLCRGEELTVFYLAAQHNVDYVYENPEKARQTNIYGLNNFLTLVPNIKKLFFASTDCVYGEGKGLSGKFSEADELAPINEYGRQKIEAENIVLSKGYTVLRFPFMLGPSLGEQSHFYDRIYSALIKGEKIELIEGMERSVVSFAQAAEYMYALSLLEETPQIINVCADEALSKYEIGRIIAEKAGVPAENIKRISEEEGKAFFKEVRASYVAMDNTLLKDLLNIEKVHWEEEIC